MGKRTYRSEIPLRPEPCPHAVCHARDDKILDGRTTTAPDISE